MSYNYNLTKNVVTSSRVEDIKKRFEDGSAISDHSKPIKLFNVGSNQRAIPFGQKHADVKKTPEKQVVSALMRSNNVRRSPAFRCDKIVKGKNVVGQRPRSYSTDSPVLDQETPTHGRVKRLHSSPGERPEPMSIMSNELEILAESIKTPKPPLRLRKPVISKPKPVISTKPTSTNMEYAVVNKNTKSPKSTKVSEMKKLYADRNSIERRADIDKVTKERQNVAVNLTRPVANYGANPNKFDAKPQMSSNDIYITNSLKKVLSSPLPPGPPPLKPPRTFAHTPAGKPPILNVSPRNIPFKTSPSTPSLYGRASKSPEKNLEPVRNNTSPNRNTGSHDLRIKNNPIHSNKDVMKKLQNETFDKSKMKPMRSKTESEIMLKKLENVLMNHQKGNVILRQRSPVDQKNLLDKSTSPENEPRPLPSLPRDISAPYDASSGCLESFNCVGAGSALFDRNNFYEKLNDKNSEFFVDIFKDSEKDIARNRLSGGLRKSSSVEHIYAEPYEFLDKSSHSLGANQNKSVPKKILAVTDSKVVEIGHFKGVAKREHRTNDDKKPTNRNGMDGLHYLCTPITSDSPPSNVRAPAAKTEESPSEASELDGRVPLSAKVKPSLLRLAGLLRGQEQNLPQVKIQMIMNEAFGLPLEGLPMADSSASDSDSASTPEDKPPTPDIVVDEGANSMPTTQTADLTQLSERRKHYVRKVSCRVAPPKSPDAFPHLFHYVLLVGLNLGCGVNQPYIKNKYPPDAEVTPHIEDFCFPDASDWPKAATNGKRDEQSYSLVITNEKGDRTFGYCRRVVPEGMDICLPLAYCIISPFRATGFYYKVLMELESRHGQPEAKLTAFIMELYNCSLPGPGQSLKPAMHPIHPNRSHTLPAHSLSVDTPDTLEPPVGVSGSPDLAASLASSLRATQHLAGSIAGASKPRALAHSATIVRRPLDLRLEECDLTQLYSALGVSTLIQVFSTLLLERKVLLFSSSLHKLSSCVEALQSLLYPFSWQHTFIPVLPVSQIEYCDAPTPYIFGVLKDKDGHPPAVSIADGVICDVDCGKLLYSQGDEATILPSKLRRGLKSALASVDAITRPGDSARNVLISEAFVRAFVELCGHYSAHIVAQQDGKRVFERESFVLAPESTASQLFLDWFSETAMFRQFVNARLDHPAKARGVFEQRARERRDEADRHAAKKVANKRFKTLGDRFKDWTPFT